MYVGYIKLVKLLTYLTSHFISTGIDLARPKCYYIIIHLS